MKLNTMKLGNMTLSEELVTPEIAARWLERNSANRRLRRQAVEMYSREMSAKRWQLKPIAICFLVDGTLVNGQHTLTAIVASGEPQVMLIARDCTKEQVGAMDIGMKRSVSDLLHFFGTDVARPAMSIARILEFGASDRNHRSFEELYEAYQASQAQIDAIWELVYTRNLMKTPAAMLAALARAYPHIDPEVMARFLDVYRDGVARGPNESSAIRLRDYMRATQHSGQTNQATWEKTVSAIDAFNAGRPMSKIYGTSKDIFPSSTRASAQ